MEAAPPGTTNNALLLNNVAATAQNATAKTQASVSTNVGLIAGAYFQAIPVDVIAIPGQVVPLVFNIVNYGNAVDTFGIYLSAVTEGGTGTSGGAWITNFGGTTGPIPVNGQTTLQC